MLNLIINIFSFLEILSISYSMIWLSDLYFSNQTYIRDIYLIISSIFCILLNGALLAKNYNLFPILVMIIMQLNSMFLLTRVESSVDKWKSNIYKVISFFYALYAIVSENWIVYLISFTIVVVMETLFSIKLEVKKYFKILNQLIYLSAFISIYFYYQIKVGNFDFNYLKISALAFMLFYNLKCFYRIKQIKDYNI